MLLKLYDCDIEMEGFVWRETSIDGCIAVRSFQSEVKEKSEKELKDEKFDFDKVITDHIIGSSQLKESDRYQPKSFVYHEKHGYLQVKKYDDVKEAYICKVKQIEEEKEGQKKIKEQIEVEIKYSEISEYIIINARVLNEN